jgi:RES domain-containing protein
MPSGWRIDKPGRKAFSGEGARRYGGRWNSPGVAVVYLSAHLSLAALEIIVHTRPLTPGGKYSAWQVTWEDAQTERLPEKLLPQNWRESPPGPASMMIGDEWAKAQRSLVLAIPSAIVSEEENYLLNPAHPDFARLRIPKPVDFFFDPRLLTT